MNVLFLLVKIIVVRLDTQWNYDVTSDASTK